MAWFRDWLTESAVFLEAVRMATRRLNVRPGVLEPLALQGLLDDAELTTRRRRKPD
jgi:hypothetical protein